MVIPQLIRQVSRGKLEWLQAHTVRSCFARVVICVAIVYVNKPRF